MTASHTEKHVKWTNTTKQKANSGLFELKTSSCHVIVVLNIQYTYIIGKLKYIYIYVGALGTGRKASPCALL